MIVGLIGLGIMGMPMLKRLCAADKKVLVCARKPEVIETAVQAGATYMDSAAELAAKVDILILCLYSDQQLRELMLDVDGGISQTLKPGATVIVHTTGSPATVKDIAAAIAERDSQVLDVPVSGGPHNIQAGNITLLAGGDAEVLARCKPVLSTYGDPILHTGPLGSGQAVKLVNNLLFGAHVDLLSEASRLFAELNIEASEAFRAISYCSGDSKVLQMALRSGSIEALQQSAERFIAKDRAVANAVATELGIDTGALAMNNPVKKRER